jgi:hypothetical protein
VSSETGSGSSAARERALAHVCQAISELAATSTGGEPSAAAELARLWAMLAELDPSLAALLRSYGPAGD